jgi:hypothetical protein
MSVGLVVLEFKIPCTPDDDPRDRIQRALRSALKLLADVSPAQALPLEGVLRDGVGYTGMYTVK